MIVDLLLKPFDNYWHKEFREADRRARFAEASWKCEKGFHEASEAECIRLSDITVLQAKSITELERELETRARRIAELEAQNEALRHELELTNVALRAEQEARKVQQLNSRLWEERRAIAVAVKDS